MNYLILAWRNLWRNRKRTLITISSVFFGVVLCTILSSMQEGSYKNMLDSIIRFYSGSIQIHDTAYWENKTINNSMEFSDSLFGIVEKTNRVTLVTPRIESFALASAGQITRGSLILGIDPFREDQITSISGKVVKGTYLKQNSNGVIIGSELSKLLKISVGDTLVLLGQGFQGVSAAGLFPVEGIIKHPSPDFDRQLIYMSLTRCQEFLSAESRITSLVIMCSDLSKLQKIKKELTNAIDPKYSVMTWEEMQPILVQYVESDRASNYIMKLILYLVIGFGILGTIIMMIIERKHELGVMMAIGMHKFRIVKMIVMETVLIGITGVVTGLIASVPLLIYLYFHPIPLTGQAAEMMIKFGFDPVLPFSLAPIVFIEQAIIVLVITMLIAVYPLTAVFRLKLTKALKA